MCDDNFYYNMNANIETMIYDKLDSYSDDLLTGYLTDQFEKIYPEYYFVAIVYNNGVDGYQNHALRCKSCYFCDCWLFIHYQNKRNIAVIKMFDSDD